MREVDHSLEEAKVTSYYKYCLTSLAQGQSAGSGSLGNVHT